MTFSTHMQNIAQLRVVIFRDGLSDSQFPFANAEIASIRKALFQMKGAKCNCGGGCKHCTPPISKLPSV